MLTPHFAALANLTTGTAKRAAELLYLMMAGVLDTDTTIDMLNNAKKSDNTAEVIAIMLAAAAFMEGELKQCGKTGTRQ
jgi:hypothetical protein